MFIKHQKKNRLPSGAKGDKMPNSQSSVPNVDTEQSINGVPKPPTQETAKTVIPCLGSTRQLLKDVNMKRQLAETQRKPASARDEKTSKSQTIQPEFETELLGLTSDQKAEICQKLLLNPNPITAADVLSGLGFRNDEGHLTFVQNHIVRDISDQDILHTLKDFFLEKSDHESAQFFSKLGSITNSRALKLISKTDPETDGKPFWHTEFSFLHPFQNGVLKVSRDGYLNLVPYEDIDVLMPAEAIIEHSLELSHDTLKHEYWQQSDFYHLTVNQATDPETQRFDTDLHKGIIYGLAKSCHLHFNPNDPCAVIFSEQTLPGERNAGGTGKGILVQAVARMHGQRPARIDGKNFNKNYAHALQIITPQTRLVWVDEVDNTEDVLNAFYTGLSDGFVINPKNRKPIVIPPEWSPRVIFTTNSPGSGVNESDLRRRFDVPLYRYYHSGHQPVDDFKRNLFGSDWMDEDWNRFYITMAVFESDYLQAGCGSGKMPRCAKALDLLSQAAAYEIDADLADFFEERYTAQMEAGASFTIASSIDLETFRQIYPQQRDGISNTRTFNLQLSKWLRLRNWKLGEGDSRGRLEGRQCRLKTAFPPTRVSIGKSVDSTTAQIVALPTQKTA